MSEQHVKAYKRSIVYIHRPFQRNFILKFCVIALLAMLCASLVLYFLSKDTMTATYRFHHLALEETAQAILPALLITNVVVLLVFILATILVTLYVSHKIGGPLYRLGKSLEAIGEGNLNPEIKLRERDQLADFASQINNMAKGLGGRVRRLQLKITGLRDKVESTSWDKEEIERDIEELEETLKELFKVD